jgi:CMP-N-acetylneuraminic acid synthetase
MVVQDGDDVRLVCPTPKDFGRRQDAPPVFDLNTVVWVYGRKALMEEKARIPKKTRLYVVPPERALDLDTELDFQILEFLMTRTGNK